MKCEYCGSSLHCSSLLHSDNTHACTKCGAPIARTSSAEELNRIDRYMNFGYMESVIAADDDIASAKERIRQRAIAMGLIHGKLYTYNDIHQSLTEVQSSLEQRLKNLDDRLLSLPSPRLQSSIKRLHESSKPKKETRFSDLLIEGIEYFLWTSLLSTIAVLVISLFNQ